MDCRRWFLLAWVLGLSCSGCVAPSGDPGGASAWPLPLGKRETKRQAKASTEVEFAKFQEGEANSAKLTPRQKESYLERSRVAYQKALDREPANKEALLGL